MQRHVILALCALAASLLFAPLVSAQPFAVEDSVIHSQAYYSYDGQLWKPFSFDGEPAIDEWFYGSASAEIPDGTHSVAYFSCSWDGGWQCPDDWVIDEVIYDEAVSVELTRAVRDGLTTAYFDVSGFSTAEDEYHIHFIAEEHLINMYFGDSPASLSTTAKYLCALVANASHDPVSARSCLEISDVEPESVSVTLSRAVRDGDQVEAYFTTDGFLDTEDYFVRFTADGELVSDYEGMSPALLTTSATSLCAQVANASDTQLSDPSCVDVEEPRTGVQRWSDPATWGGSLPQQGDTVTITADMEVLLDTNPPALAGINIQGGTLEFDRRDLSVTTDYIRVMDGGLLQIGTVNDPFEQKAIITLTGSRADLPGPDGCGVKVVCSMGGRLELHGAVRGPVWTRLADGATANPGDTSITVQESVDWLPGDEIVVASTDYDPGLAEKRVITSVNGNEVSFAEPLEFMHYSKAENFGGKVLDERAEVLHLTRNILIQGDEGSSDENFGGHVMAMNEHAGEQFARVFRDGEEFIDVWVDYENDPSLMPHVSGVEFFRMGQAGVLARYPWHWHMYGDAESSYIRDSSVHKSFQRCTTIHGTFGALVKKVVGYDIIGHCFFFEDGIETGNTVDGSVGALIKNYDDRTRRLIGSDSRPSVFWVTNTDNTIINNVAAGAYGFGFWYDIKKNPTGPSSTERVSPRDNPNFRTFRNNSAHSNAMTWRQAGVQDFTGGWGQQGVPEPDSGTGLFFDQTVCKPERGGDCHFEDFQTYKNDGIGYWSTSRGGAKMLDGAVIADTPFGLKVRGDSQDVVVVAQTGNLGNPGKSGDGVVANEWVWPLRFDYSFGHAELEEYESLAGRSLPAMPEMVKSPDKLDWIAQKSHYTGTTSTDHVYIGYSDEGIFDRALFRNPGNAESQVFELFNAQVIGDFDVFNHNDGYNGITPRIFVIEDETGTISGTGEYTEYRYYDHYAGTQDYVHQYTTNPIVGMLNTSDCIDTGELRLMQCRNRTVQSTIIANPRSAWGDKSNVMLEQESTGVRWQHPGEHTRFAVNETYHFIFLDGLEDFVGVRAHTTRGHWRNWVTLSWPSPVPRELRTEGDVEYVDSLEAMYDSYASFAVYHDGSRLYVKLRGNPNGDRNFRIE